MPLNIRLVAVQIGDILKNATTLNEVGRAASAIFRFDKESFPHDSITSQRAQLIFDWIMTLGKQRMTNAEREALLRQFVLAIAPDSEHERVSRILGQAGAAQSREDDGLQAAFIARELHPDVARHAQRYFLQRNFFHAVFEAAKGYNKAVREKARSSKDRRDLMLAVWGPDTGVLKFTPCVSDTDKNQQDGIKFLSAGLMSAIRNPTAHEPALDWPIGMNDCLDI